MSALFALTYLSQWTILKIFMGNSSYLSKYLEFLWVTHAFTGVDNGLDGLASGFGGLITGVITSLSSSEIQVHCTS